MRVVVTHHDPLYYEKLVVTYPYLRLPGGEILPWDCTTEEANDKAQCSRRAPWLPASSYAWTTESSRYLSKGSKSRSR
jgi:hypothetical protein